MASRLSLAFLALVVQFMPSEAGAQTPAAERARAEVEEANRQELDAVVRGDAAAAAEWFMPDAVLLPPDGSIVRGRSAIEAFWTPTPGTEITDARTELERFDVRSDLAYLVGSYQLDSVTDGESSRTTGRFFMIWQRTPRGWRIAVDMWN